MIQSHGNERSSDLVNMGSTARVSWSTKRAQRRGSPAKRVPLSSDEPIRVDRIVTVADKNLAHELDEWLPSARLCYPGVPLHVATDIPEEEFQSIASRLNVENVIRMPLDLSVATPKVQKVNKWAEHWILEAIWAKLDTLRSVVTDHPGEGVMLADADITFLKRIDRSFHADVVLSPYYFGDFTQKTRDLDGDLIPLAERDGWFNAGMILTRSKEFCDWWIPQYEAGHPGSFVEQSALELVPGSFATEYLDARHNFGKWRLSPPAPDTASIHMHIHEKSHRTDITMLKIAAQKAAAKARRILRDNPDKRA